MLANADRLAEDLQLWATVEFGFIELADRHSRISIIMPQKKNPYSLAFVRGVAREMIGRLASVVAHQVTPSGQIDNRIFAYGGVPQALEQTRQALQLLAGTVAGLTINQAVMAQRAGQSYSGATDLTEIIMLATGIDIGAAHRIVGQAIRAALQAAQPLNPEWLDQAANNVIGRPLNLSQAQIAPALDPLAIVETRTGPGGAAPASVQKMIETYRTSMAEAASWRLEAVNRLTRAEARLLERVRELS
jgi:argininosuccinate lyase